MSDETTVGVIEVVDSFRRRTRGLTHFQSAAAQMGSWVVPRPTEPLVGSSWRTPLPKPDQNAEALLGRWCRYAVSDETTYGVIEVVDSVRRRTREMTHFQSVTAQMGSWVVPSSTRLGTPLGVVVGVEQDSREADQRDTTVGTTLGVTDGRWWMARNTITKTRVECRSALGSLVSSCCVG